MNIHQRLASLVTSGLSNEDFAREMGFSARGAAAWRKLVGLPQYDNHQEVKQKARRQRHEGDILRLAAFAQQLINKEDDINDRDNDS